MSVGEWLYTWMNDYTHLGVYRQAYTNEHAYNREEFRIIKYYCKDSNCSISLSLAWQATHI